MEINENITDMVESVIDVQESHRDQINELSQTVECIRATMMTTLRFELKDEMMKCALRGYRTPEETEEIEAKFHDYVYNLNGNHGLELIYENDFLTLPIKERKKSKWSLFMK